ncbi:MAG: hypothetical protein FGM14_15550 [Flavobacteriales bacterium]|nr:hypothetical protein [Flavobacteriales bacterium]
MKKLLFVFFISLTPGFFSQTDPFQLGWYMVKEGAQLKVVQGNSDDVYEERDWSQVSYDENEVLLVFNFTKDKYYCFDPDGRVVLVKGKESLKKIDIIGRPGKIQDESGSVKIGLDLTLNNGNNVWITGFNSSTKTAIIMLVDGQKVEIPQANIQDLKEYIDLMDKLTEWKTVD